MRLKLVCFKCFCAFSHIPDSCISLIIIVEYFVCDLPYDLYLPDMHCVRYLFPLNLFAPANKNFWVHHWMRRRRVVRPGGFYRPSLAKGHEVGD
jgi:hypothetical protein